MKIVKCFPIDRPTGYIDDVLKFFKLKSWKQKSFVVYKVVTNALSKMDGIIKQINFLSFVRYVMYELSTGKPHPFIKSNFNAETLEE